MYPLSPKPNELVAISLNKKTVKRFFFKYTHKAVIKGIYHKIDFTDQIFVK